MVKPLEQFTEGVQVQPRALPDRQAAISSLGDRLTQFGVGVAKIAAARSKEDLTAEKDAAQIQVRDGISKIRENVLDPAKFSDGATDSYDAQVRGLMKGVLSTSDPKIRPFINNFGSYYGDRNRNVVVGRVEKLKKNQLVGGLQEYNTKTTDDAINSLLSDEVIPDPEDKTKSISKGDVLIGRVNQANDSAMNRGLITPKEAFAYKQAAEKSYAEAGYLHHFRQILANQKQNPNKWLESLGKNKTIEPAMKYKVQGQAFGMMNQIKQGLETNTNLIKQQADDTVRQVSQGTLDINDPHVSNVKLRTGALPVEDQQNFEHRLTAASVFSVTKKSMKFVPFTQSRAVLKQLEPASDDPGFKFKNKINSALESQINTFQAEFKKDPFGYVSDNPDVIKAFEARMTAANDGVTKIQPAQLQSINPLAVALEKERAMGANDQQLSVMSTSTAANIVASVEAQADPAQQLQFINDVYDSYGQYKTIAAKDLKKAGMPQNIMDLANLENIPKSKPFIQGILNSVQQSQAIKKGIDDAGKVGSQWNDFRQNASSELANLFDTYGNTPDSEEFKNNMVGLVTVAAAGDVLAGKSDNAKSAAKKMADVIYNNRYSGYVKGIRVPINVCLDNAKDAMFAMEKNLKDTDFKVLKRDPSFTQLTEGEMKTEDRNLIETGSWRTITDDSGVYWVDHNGFTPMVKSDESRIMNILQNNSDKNFVQRILNPEGKPILDLGKGQFATHKMSWATVDGKPIVYPKVIEVNGKLKELSAKDALNHAIKTKQFITMKNADEAEWFSSNYKKVWNIRNGDISLKTDFPADKRYEIHWKDLQDKTSKLHGLIAKHKRKFLGFL